MSIGIEFKHITKRYTESADTPPAVNNISFTVPAAAATYRRAQIEVGFFRIRALAL